MSSLIRLLKAVIWGFVALIALCFVFVTIPSPVVPESQIASDLQNGVPVMRAYKFGHFLPYPTFPFEITHDFDEVMAFQWSFSADTHTLHINQQYDILLKPGHQPGYIASINATVITNVRDGPMLPYFNMADATLLNNEIMPHIAVLHLQLRQRSTPETTTVYDIVGDSPKDIANLRPLLTITYESTSELPSIPKFDFPQEPYSASPSTTFPIRRAILGPLVPVAFVVMFSFSAMFALIEMLLALMGLGGILVLLFGLPKGWRIGRIEMAARGESPAMTETEAKGSDAETTKTYPGPADNIV